MPTGPVDAVVIHWLKQLQHLPAAGRGWVRAVRTQRNMQGKQLAKRMNVSPARISVLEKDEQRGAVTLKMMQKAADALDCHFVYAFVPKTAAQQDKPKIRLDAAYMQEDRERQLDELQQEYARSLSKTTSA